MMAPGNKLRTPFMDLNDVIRIESDRRRPRPPEMGIASQAVMGGTIESPKSVEVQLDHSRNSDSKLHHVVFAQQQSCLAQGMGSPPPSLTTQKASGFVLKSGNTMVHNSWVYGHYRISPSECVNTS